jgi:hypothetical protein
MSSLPGEIGKTAPVMVSSVGNSAPCTCSHLEEHTRLGARGDALVASTRARCPRSQEKLQQFSQRLDLLDKVEHSWEWRDPRDDRNKFRSTLRWTRTPRATRQSQTGVNVSENCYKYRSVYRRRSYRISANMLIACSVEYLCPKAAPESTATISGVHG